MQISTRACLNKNGCYKYNSKHFNGLTDTPTYNERKTL